ncbi:MAG: CDP-diacylglycerol--glycerol-3-phosphate 3-phosphatidyltransferase [SAR324 cluster bacterium]|nr:CDP-diacylglycerol--glycerol-3-phosphate 3-phosphatidyltransferase [SAR324 cluster bacterium]
MIKSLFRWVTPNQLTVGRILSIPVLLVLISLDRPLTNNAAWVLYTIACLTDYWDGVLARERGEVTQLGRLLDPIADKMLILSSLILLVSMGFAAVIPTILITLREFAVGGLRSVAAVEGVLISSVKGAKWKTVLQMLATGTLILHHNPFTIPADLIGEVLLWVAAAWTLWTGYVYFAGYLKIALKN